MTSQEFEASVLAKGYTSTQHIERAAGFSMGEHQHPFDACALVMAGTFFITLKGVQHSYAAGDIFELAAGTLHSESAGPAGATYLAGRRQVATA